ncbi:hypothetical protein D0C36_04100 [Mucilaginibacter conchicola]|uniref:Tail specific protease domain-containing protein n=1 Tax=Mucilaginibacter conchicola TaxID=2303333 RepID=A0A372NYX7_9SPHI|nr:S41 family peptidase [Mucilaginibacter conchicola]RFZ94727.1 hypothetical protein D0C36_04100 [Mucilaginibacter conchicola]
MKILLVILILSIPNIVLAQQCDCKVNFDYTVNHVRTDYAGFNDKVKKSNIKAFEKFTALLRSKALTTNSVDSCYVLLRTWTNYFKDNHLRVQLDWRYRKAYPEVAKKLNQQFAKPVATSSADKPDPETNFKVLDNQMMLLRLPSFEWSEKKSIDSLFKLYEKELKHSANWIIDLRENTGGTDYAFSSLMPYVYTNPIKIKPDEYLSSEENIRILTENLKGDDMSKAGKDFLGNLIALMKNHPNQFVNPSGKDEFEIKMDSVHQYPARIAILIDRYTASSAESFLLSAVQSKKVKVYGEHSAGTLDYSNTQFFDIPAKEFNLVIPIARSMRLPEHPIDNIGVKPDVKIDAGEKDKIGYVRKVMEKDNK